MTITISANAYWEVLLETEHTICSYDLDDPLDVSWQYPPRLGKGQSRLIDLREGVYLSMGHCQLHDDLIMKVTEREHPLEFGFYLSGVGETQSAHASYSEQWYPRSYFLAGSGVAPKEARNNKLNNYQVA